MKYDKPSLSSQSHPRILHYGLPGFWDNVEPDAMAMAQNAQIVAASSGETGETEPQEPNAVFTGQGQEEDGENLSNVRDRSDRSDSQILWMI